MTTTDIPPEAPPDLPAFDPGAVTPELLDSLNRDRLREVLAHHGVPDQPKAATKGDLLTLARLALAAQAQPALESGPPAEPAEPGVALEAPPQSVVPTASRWQLIVQMAEYLAKSNLTPDALRGKPHDCGAILLRANDLGIPLTSAMEQLYVIKGKVGMESKLMRALVRRDGHSIGPELSDDPGFVAYYAGRRVDNGDAYTATFDLDDAQDQDLIAGYTRNEDGTITIQPILVQGKSIKPQWVKDTKNMLKERACARLCRELFSDCLAGVSYTPDELGFIDVDPADEPRRGRAGEDEPTITLHQQQSQIAARIEELPADLKDELRDAWKRRNLPGPAKLTAGSIRTALNLLEPVEAKARERQEAAEADITDAEVVEDADTADETPGEPEATQAPTEAVEDADEGPWCGGCGEKLTDEATIVYDDQERPWHAECAPFV